MAMIAFTRNYHDHSNNLGYQFEFFCDKCNNGHRSAFKANKVGMAGEFMRAAGSLFGGVFSSAASASDHVKDALRGTAWDEAYNECVTEAKTHFHQCTRCGKWVCPEVCWNTDRGQCKECSPNLIEEATSAQAQAASEQVHEKARATDQTGGLDLTQHLSVPAPVAAAAPVDHSPTVCPHCNAKATGGKFCSECGKPMLVAKTECASCHAKLEPGAKFCPECGVKV